MMILINLHPLGNYHTLHVMLFYCRSFTVNVQIKAWLKQAHSTNFKPMSATGTITDITHSVFTI